MVLKKTPESPLDSKEIKPVNLKGNQLWILFGRTDDEVETPVYWSSDANNWLNGKVPDTGKDWGQKEKRVLENEMAGWHHWCNGRKLGQTSGDSDGQRGLTCCSPWGHKVSNMTGWLNKNNNNLKVGQKFRHGLSKSSISETCCSVAKFVQLFATPRTTACRASLYFTISWSLLKLCPLSHWCHPTISFSATPFSPCPQSFLASRSFLMSQLFTSGGQNIGASASASVLPMNIQGWFTLGLTGLISLLSKWLSRVYSRTTNQSIDCLVLSFFMVQFSHLYMTTGKTIALTTWIISLLAKWCLSFLLHSLG